MNSIGSYSDQQSNSMTLSDNNGSKISQDKAGEMVSGLNLPNQPTMATINLDPNEPFQKQLGNYYIKQTLGSGTFCKTKLGICKTTGQKVAIKILKNNINQSCIKTVLTEINALKAIGKHPNIIELIGYNQGEYMKRKESRIVTFIVLELAAGGELFNLI